VAGAPVLTVSYREEFAHLGTRPVYDHTMQPGLFRPVWVCPLKFQAHDEGPGRSGSAFTDREDCAGLTMTLWSGAFPDRWTLLQRSSITSYPLSNAWARSDVRAAWPGRSAGTG